MERPTGLEPALSAWKAEVLAIKHQGRLLPPYAVARNLLVAIGATFGYYIIK